MSDRREYMKKWRASNLQHCLEYSRNHYLNNKEYYRKKRAHRYKKNRAAEKEGVYAYRAANPGFACSVNVKRQQHVLLATPKWADHRKIRAKYRQAAQKTARTGRRYVVDHVIPLRGKNVCGLHVETNLRVVLESTNCSKGHQFNGGDNF